MTEQDGLILAIDAGGTFFKSGLVSADGKILEHTRVSCPVDSAGQASSVRSAYHILIARQLENARAIGRAIKAVEWIRRARSTIRREKASCGINSQLCMGSLSVHGFRRRRETFPSAFCMIPPRSFWENTGKAGFKGRATPRG